MPRPCHKQAGFSLIEVIVALAVTGIALGAAFHLFGTAFLGHERAEHTTVALLLAESKLAEVHAIDRLRPGRNTGRTKDGYVWVTEVRNYAGLAGNDRNRLPVRAYELKVTVSWSGATHSAVTLETMFLRANDQNE